VNKGEPSLPESMRERASASTQQQHSTGKSRPALNGYSIIIAIILTGFMSRRHRPLCKSKFRDCVIVLRIDFVNTKIKKTLKIMHGIFPDEPDAEGLKVDEKKKI
jgi:hypothetical protein